MARVYTLLLTLAAATGLSALTGIAMALLNAPPAWFAICFEVVVLLSAVFGVVTARGLIKDGVALSLLCVGGAVGVASVLGWFSCGRQLMGWSVTIPLLLRLAVAGVFTLAAGAEVLRHDPIRAAGLLARGVVAGAPGAVVLWAVATGRLTAWLAPLPGATRAPLMFFGALVVGGLACAGIHWVIKAFTVASEAGERARAGGGGAGQGAASASGSTTAA